MYKQMQTHSMISDMLNYLFLWYLFL